MCVQEAILCSSHPCVQLFDWRTMQDIALCLLVCCCLGLFTWWLGYGYSWRQICRRIVSSFNVMPPAASSGMESVFEHQGDSNLTLPPAPGIPPGPLMESPPAAEDPATSPASDSSGWRMPSPEGRHYTSVKTRRIR